MQIGRNFQRYKNRNHRWNRITITMYSTLVLVLVFSFLVLVSCNFFHQKNSSDIDISIRLINGEPMYDDSTETCQWEFKNTDSCSIICEQIHVTSIGNSVEHCLQERSSCYNSGLKLQLKSINFTNIQFNENWLNYKNASVIKELILEQITIDELSDEAFKTLSTMEMLTIQNTTLKTLKSNCFSGLTSLRHLTLKYLPAMENINGNVLLNLNESLNYLSINIDIDPNVVMSTKSIVIDDFLKSIELHSLQVADFSYSNFTGNQLTNETFNGICKSLKQLYLSNCQIETLDVNTFQSVSETIELIDLRHNRIITIPDGIFIAIIVNRSFVKIFLSYNPWECNCSLQHLKDLQKNYPNIFMDILYCKNYAGQRFDKITFCSNGTESTRRTSSSSTTRRTTTTTTGKYSDYDQDYEDPYKAPKYTDPLIFTQECPSQTNPNNFNTINLEQNTNQMKIHQAPKSDAEVIIEFSENLHEFVLLWFAQYSLTNHSTNRTEVEVENLYDIYGDQLDQQQTINCIDNIDKRVSIKNLNLETTYTFCIMNSSATTISPLNCLPFYTKITDPKHKLWIPQDAKILVICLVIMGVIFNGFLGCIIGVCLVRHYPTLLRGSKRVVIVNSRTTDQPNDVMVMPPDWATRTDSVTTCSTLPYRRYSDATIASGKSYVTTTNQLSQFDIIKRRLEMEKQLEAEGCYYYIKHLNEEKQGTPPPLPPPNRCSLSSTTSTLPLCSVSAMVQESEKDYRNQ